MTMSKVWGNRRLILLSMYFGLCTSEAMFHKQLKRMKVARNEWPSFIKNDHSDATAHFFEMGGEVSVLVCIRTRQKITPIQVACLLVHEAVHIWQHYTDSIGEKNPSSEFEAYSIQAISQELMELYEGQMK